MSKCISAGVLKCDGTLFEYKVIMFGVSIVLTEDLTNENQQ